MSDELGDLERQFADSARRQRAELRHEQEELEGATEELARKNRDLVDIALEAMHRGDVVAATVGDRSFRGAVVHVGEDNMRLADGVGNEIDLLLAGLSTLQARPGDPSQGRAIKERHPARFLDVFLDPEATGAQVEVGGPALAPTTGRLAVLAGDHLVIRARSGDETVVPLRAVVYVIRR